MRLEIEWKISQNVTFEANVNSGTTNNLKSSKSQWETNFQIDTCDFYKNPENPKLIILGYFFSPFSTNIYKYGGNLEIFQSILEKDTFSLSGIGNTVHNTPTSK